MDAIVYEIEDVYKIVSNSQMIGDIWAASEPIFTIRITSSDSDIYEALISALTSSKKNVLEESVISYKDFYKRLGLKKGVKLENVAKSFFVRLETNSLTFTPCSRDKDGSTIYYVEKDDEDIVVEKPEMVKNWRKLFVDVFRKCD